MKKGDIIQIEGNLGFLSNPTMEVLEVKGKENNGLVLLRDVEAVEGGLLSCMNVKWYGRDTISRRIKKL